MQEYIFLIRNDIDHQADWTDERLLQFIKDREAYTARLREDGRLVAAQPLVKTGVIISRSNDDWNIRPMRGKGEVQVGYYHVLAENMDEAIAMAKLNPEFAYGTHARIEIRPVRNGERDAGNVRQK